MGDNIWLPDRDAVRTPMQWTPDRNAGFSTADPGKLYLPAVQSLQYHYAAVNVESQLSTSSSLLNWVRSMLQTRRDHPAFGMGAYLAVEADNPAVLAFLRVLETDRENGVHGEVILCVNNLSRTAQGTRLRLPEWAGCEITDIFGGSGFDPIPEDGELSLTMGSRDFYWLTVSGGSVTSTGGGSR
jgi:maltose alpha-D-glucosyltransferase/alpha-amylase